MDNLIAQALGTLTLPLMLPDLINLSRVAASRNISVEELLLELIRGATHKKPIVYTAPDTQQSKVAEETTPPAED
jgi:hypothetical protein